MTWRDKLEIGLKENASFRKDNLPPVEVTGPELGQGPGRSAEIPDARTTSSDADDEAASEASAPGARTVCPEMPTR
jgi:hypothetical protein